MGFIKNKNKIYFYFFIPELKEDKEKPYSGEMSSTVIPRVVKNNLYIAL